MWYSLTYTDDIDPGCAGSTFAWFIKIRPDYKDDLGLMAHELQHVKQFWRTCGLHLFLRNFKWYKLKIEVSAYKEQLRWPPAVDFQVYYRKLYAGFISTKYGLDISEDEAYKLLA